MRVVNSRGFDLVVRRGNPRESEIREISLPEPEPGQATLRVQRFALTANNVTYAVLGDQLGYWQFYPAPDGWGHVPAWGFAEVVESATDNAVVVDRLYGFWPMSTFATIRPTGKRGSRLIDATDHRQALPSLYNAYLPAGTEDAGREELESLLRPLFGTAWLIADLLEQAQFDNAATLVLSSASSKTALATGWCLSQQAERPEIVGLTSHRNRSYVADHYDRVITYDELPSAIIAGPVSFVDFAGNESVRRAVHGLLTDSLVRSMVVGGTHWENPAGFAPDTSLPGPAPEFFFAPSRMEVRTAELGTPELVRRISSAQGQFLEVYGCATEIVRPSTPDDVRAAWLALVRGETDPSTGVVATL